MSTPTRTRHRCALGPCDVNISTSYLIPAKHHDGDAKHEAIQRDHSVLPCKRSVECSDNGQTSKAARYFGVTDRGVGIEHWLEDGATDGSPLCLSGNDTRAYNQFGIQENAHLLLVPQESILSAGVTNVEGTGNKLSLPAVLQETLQSSRLFDSNSHAKASFSTSAVAIKLRLRLRMALFKVQTNQTAIPISHLQLPEYAPQPLSVFPPSLVKISAPNEVHNVYYKDHRSKNSHEIGSTASPPPSSPPPLTRTVARYTAREITFIAPVRLSSPSPNYGKPIDFCSSSDSQGEISRSSPTADLNKTRECHEP